MANVVRFAVVGVGSMGHLHAEYLASRVPNAKLVALADVDVAKAREVGAPLGVDACFSTLTEVLAQVEIDAVVVASPRRTHASTIIEAAEAGKHVFSEKPMANTLEEIDAATAAVEKAVVALQVGFHRRFDPSFRRVREAIGEGDIGEPRIVHSISRDPVWGSSSRLPEDLLLETTIHDFDVVRHMSGSEIVSVHATGIASADAGRLEGVIVSLRLANGALATIDNHVASAYGYDQRVEVFGSLGVASVANHTPHRATVVDAGGAIGAPPLHFFAERYADAYIAELAAFTRCVLDGSEPLVGARDARAAQVAAFAALESLRTGETVRV
ncbi:MAG: Gfo/Idh/MocA family oxidoreductase [Chloroflexota bacterium]